MKSGFSVVMTDYQYDSISPIRDGILAAGHTFQVYQCRTAEEVIAAAKDADAVITHFAPIDRTVIESLTHCKLIIRGAVGVDNIDIQAAKERGIPVANVPDYGREDVANHVLMLMLALNKKLCLLNDRVKHGQWDFNQAKPIFRLAGKTVGLLGFGGIARLVAQKCQAFSVNVQAYDPFVSEETGEQYGVAIRSLEDVLRTSDYISLHLPLNAETKGLLNAERLGMLRKGCILINTSRGGVIDEVALTEALQSGQVAAAGLDVLETESICTDHPFCTMEQVILTPHSAWYSEESVQTLLSSVAEEVIRALEGKTLRNQVNR